MNLKLTSILCPLLLVTGCATLNPISGRLDDLPIIPFGGETPTDGEFILHFPQAVPIETSITFAGNLFIASDVQTMQVRPKQDIYLYREWVSFDLQRWRNASETLHADLKMQLPGYDHPGPGYLHLRLDKIDH